MIERVGDRTGAVRIMLLGRWVLVLLALSATAAAAPPIRGLAFVQEDATLRINRKVIRLYGIHIPSTDQSCRTDQRPVLCAPRAALALERKAKGFVRCAPMDTDGRVVIGRCYAGATPHSAGEDLSAYMLAEGWAVALPEAPFEYQTLERIAKHKGIGIWGVPIDRPRLRPSPAR